MTVIPQTSAPPESGGTPECTWRPSDNTDNASRSNATKAPEDASYERVCICCGKEPEKAHELSLQQVDEILRIIHVLKDSTMPTHESTSGTSPPAEHEFGTCFNARTAAGSNLQQALQKAGAGIYLDYAGDGAHTMTDWDLLIIGFDCIKQLYQSKKPFPAEMIALVKVMNVNVDNFANTFRQHTGIGDPLSVDIKELLLKLSGEILKESKDRDERLQTAVDKVLQLLVSATQLYKALTTQQEDHMSRHDHIDDNQKSRGECKIQLPGDIKKCLNGINKGQDNLKKGQDDVLSQLRENRSQYERMIQALETNNKLLQVLVNLQTNTPAKAPKDKDDNSAHSYSGPSKTPPLSASEGRGKAKGDTQRELAHAKHSQATE